MQPLSEAEIKQKLKAAFWDIKVDINTLFIQIIDKENDKYLIDKRFLYSRLLLSIDWYSLLKIIPRNKWNEMLEKSVISMIFPKSLHKRYEYAQRILLP
jgi:hypothetical protein